MRQNLRAAAAAIGILGLAAPAARAEEGMWTFDNFPADRMREQMGWAPDQAWLDRAMVGVARMPGCSASNVSGQGLMLTNHHCVILCLEALSSAEANYIDAGFMARARAEEQRCPNTAVLLLTGVEDVTERINAAAAGVAPEGFAQARDAEIQRIQRGCNIGVDRCEVVALYDGGRYALNRYRRFDDVRLVFAPEQSVAAFGGAADNFQFPRYCLDVAFLRLYENGAPAVTPRHLSMRFTPIEENEIMLIAGNPGRTSRFNAAAELMFERDVELPWRVATLDTLQQRLAAYAALGPDQARVAAPEVQEVRNLFAAYSGRLQALSDPQGFAHITEREQDLQTRVHRNLAARRDMGDAWGEIQRAEAAYRGFYYAHQYLEARAGERSLMFAWARDIVRAAAEREKPDAQRLPRYVAARLPAVEQNLRATRSVTPDLEALNLTAWLEGLSQRAGAANARAVLGGETPAALAARLAQSRLADPAFRLELWQGGAAAVAASDDPMIVFVRSWDAAARAIQQRYVADVEAPVALAEERIARARFRAFGTAHYPDATFSPRLSYGRVEGWVEPGNRVIAPFTRTAGLYERNTGQPPFALSQRWIEARPRLDPNAVFNLSTSHDVIGGSSGSPLLDRDGRVAGVAFDGNIHSLGGEYFYDGATNRSVNVSSTIIRAALADVYGMHALLGELETHDAR